MKVEAVISPKAESKLEFADGSKRYLLATQREGKATGNGPLAGATMLEWGTHDVTPGIGSLGNGYLVFTTTEGDVAYLKYQFRAIAVPGPDGKPQNLINGFWEVAGGIGKLKGMQGAGTVHVNTVSPKERQWILEGDLELKSLKNSENRSSPLLRHCLTIASRGPTAASLGYPPGVPSS